MNNDFELHKSYLVGVLQVRRISPCIGHSLQPPINFVLEANPNKLFLYLASFVSIAQGDRQNDRCVSWGWNLENVTENHCH